MRPQPAAQGSAAAGAFAAMICFLDGLLLLGVAFTQLAAGGLGILVGLWNLAVTLAYAAAALGLARREDWGYRWGLRLAVTNVGLLFAQATFWGAVGASEEAVYPLCVLIVGDVVLAATLLAVKNTIAPPLQPRDIATPPTLAAELDQALPGVTPAPAQTGLITPAERDLLISVRQAFIADQSRRKLAQVRTDLEIEGEHVDLIVRDWSDAVLSLGGAGSKTLIYLFRAFVDEDLVAWMKRTVWKKEAGFTIVVAIAASRRALETGGGGFFDAGVVGLYALRDGGKCTKFRARNVVGEFEKWYKRWSKAR